MDPAMRKKICAIILAGGKGERLKNVTGEVPKQLFKVNSKSIISLTLNQFVHHKDVDSLVITVTKGMKDLYEKEFSNFDWKNKQYLLIEGGQTRQESSYISVKATQERFPKTHSVLIHDAARPFISHESISKCIHETLETGACEICIQATDTIIESQNQEFVDHVLSREKIYYTQTPQGFHLGIILKAHQKAIEGSFFTATDDASLVMRLGQKIKIVIGNPENIKITTPKDIAIAQVLNDSHILNHIKS